MSRKLKTGDILGQWTLVGDSHIGKGGNSYVWEVVNSANERGAIKFLQLHLLEQINKPHGARRVRRFLREIGFYCEHGKLHGILQCLDHHLPEAPSANDPPWIVLARAVPLSKAIPPTDRRLETVVGWVAEVAQTLTMLHSQRVYHRDLKPDNLFLIENHAVVGDFGLVDLPEATSLTETGEIVGPFLYAAPEMFSSGKDGEFAPADVYSLAKTLWVLATGQRYPLLGEQRRDVEALRLSSYIRHPRAVLLDAVLEAATQTDPNQRPTMASLARNLREWLEVVMSAEPRSLAHLAEQMRATLEATHRATRRAHDNEEKAKQLLTILAKGVESLRSTIAVIDESCEIGASAKVLSQVRANSCKFDRSLSWGPELGVCVRIVSKGNNRQFEQKTRDVFYWGGVGVQIADSGAVYVCAAHHIIFASLTEPVWEAEELCLPDTGLLQNAIQRLTNGLHQNAEAAIKKFIERVNYYQPPNLR